MYCTCSHICHGATNAVLHHDWQVKAWRENKVYEPCTQIDCRVYPWCRRQITQEDMLCDYCRDMECISLMQSDQIRVLLEKPYHWLGE